MIPENLLHQTSMMVAGRLGWDFSSSRTNDLERGLTAMARELGISETSEAVAEWLSGVDWNLESLNTLATYLTVGETYFFREKAGLDFLQQRIIPEIMSERKGKDQYLNLWSAGCCTGEEPYTLAMILKEMIPGLKDWKVNILATDINRKFIKKARSGIYGNWSFRETNQSIKNRYFSKSGTHWHLSPEIQEMVTFAQLNLAEDHDHDTWAGIQHIDVIFCRNVLMYFTPEQIRMVTHRLYQSLSNRGWLVTSAVELNDDYFAEFSKVRFDQNIFYRKCPDLREYRLTPTEGQPAVKSFDVSKKHLIKTPEKKTVPAFNSSPTAPIRKSADEKEQPLREIQLLFNQGEYHPCIGKCLSAMNQNSAEISILTYLIRSYANLGNLAEARKWGERMLMQNEAGADAYHLVATILMEENEAAQAESMLKRALFLNPNHLLSHFLMGNVLNRLGKKNLAVKHFRNVKELLTVFNKNETLPGSEGLTAGRMLDFVEGYL